MGKVRGRPFEPGNSFGKGRPRGSRNKKSGPDNLFREYAEPLRRTALSLALQKDKAVLRFCLGELSRLEQADRVPVKLPSTKTMKDVSDATVILIEEVSRGKLPASEATKMMNLLESRSRVIEHTDFGARLEVVERAINRGEPTEFAPVYMPPPPVDLTPRNPERRPDPVPSIDLHREGPKSPPDHDATF